MIAAAEQWRPVWRPQALFLLGPGSLLFLEREPDRVSEQTKYLGTLSRRLLGFGSRRRLDASEADRRPRLGARECIEKRLSFAPELPHVTTISWVAEMHREAMGKVARQQASTACRIELRPRAKGLRPCRKGRKTTH